MTACGVFLERTHAKNSVGLSIPTAEGSSERCTVHDLPCDRGELSESDGVNFCR